MSENEVEGAKPVNMWVVVIARRGLNVRERPNLKARIMNKLAPGTRKHIKRLKSHQGYLWGEIDHVEPIDGQRWVALRKDEQVLKVEAVDYVEVE